MNSWYEDAKRMAEEGLSNRQIADKLGINYNTVRSYLLKEGYLAITRPNHVKVKHSGTRKSSYSYCNGIGTYEDEMQIIDGKEITPELIMEAKGLKVEDWEVVSFTRNVWQSQTKECGTIDLCQSKLSVRPKRQTEITFKDIDEYFKRIPSKKETVIPFKYDEGKEVLEICLTDAHIGLLSWKNETGENFDLKIANRRLTEAIADLVERAKNKKFKKIYFCTLGDVLHIDNGETNTTTRGTIQQVDGRLPKIFDFAVNTMEAIIDQLLELNTPIEYVYTCGNHDRNTGYFLVKCLEKSFSNNPNVKFDITPNPMKAIHFGKVLIGLTHNDISKKQQGTWIINDCRKELGESNFIEEHTGHIHTEEAKMVNGIMVRSCLAQCGNSYWEHQQGYRSERGLMAFVWNEEKGLRETWYYYF